jgi:hypothetical protein
MSTLKGRILLIELAAIYHSEVARIEGEMLRIRGLRKRGHNLGGSLTPLARKGIRATTRALEQILNDPEQTFDHKQQQMLKNYVRCGEILASLCVRIGWHVLMVLPGATVHGTDLELKFRFAGDCHRKLLFDIRPSE